jgi:hypothetical protein
MLTNDSLLALAMKMFTSLPSISKTDDTDIYVVNKDGAKPALIHENDDYIIMWVDEDFCTIKDFEANTPERVISLAFNWCVENKLISIN